MSGSLNRVTLIGHLGQDPDIRRTQGGQTIVTLSLATSESWRDKQSGERREKTEWHRIIVFNEGLAKIAEQYLKKGMKIYAEGALQTRKWQDQQGHDRYTTEVVMSAYNGMILMLSSPDGTRSSAADRPTDDGSAYRAAKSGEPPKRPAAADPMDDEIPF